MLGVHVFGLTGGIGSGKSRVAEHWRGRGLPVVDADRLARDAVAPGSAVLGAIVAEFGDSVLCPDGSLDRARLAECVFADAAARERLNHLVHPEVRRRAGLAFSELAAGGAALACYEVPLLFETGLHTRYRPVVVVSAPEDVQLARAAARDGTSEETVLRRVRSQMPLAEKVLRADHVIDNAGEWPLTQRRADQVLASICHDLGVSGQPYAEPLRTLE